MYDRLVGVFLKEELDILASANIFLVGLGGVGSFCFEALVRSGIKNITIADFDTYEESNLNRQLHSNRFVIGKKKVEVIKEDALKINKDLNIKVLDEFISSNSQIDFQTFDYVIDACDDIDAKVYLITKSFAENVKVISAMGIGNRLSIKDIEITTLDKTFNDPLAKKLRTTLRKREFTKKVKVVFSKEKPQKVDNYISSYMPITAHAGLLLADYVIKDLIKYGNNKN